MTTYRDIWKKAYGAIPKDSDGISFEIHHVDGNRNNNNLTNLQCVSIEEHFNIHLNQGDFSAALRILTKIEKIKQNLDLGITPPSLAQYMIEHKLGTWSDEAKAKALETKRRTARGFCHNREIQSKGGKIGGKKGQKASMESQKEKGIGFYSSELQSTLGKKGGAIAGKMQKGREKPKVICPHCGKTGGGQALMNRWHFDNCKSKDD
jgi:hypothetical protein